MSRIVHPPPYAQKAKRGVILFLVLMTLLVVVLLVNIVLRLVSSQARLGYHQRSRIQAYYASLAGVNYAFEQLRTGTWVYVNETVHDCPDDAPCQLSLLDPLFNTTFPRAIEDVEIVLCPANTVCHGTHCTPPSNYTFCVNSFVNYTYIP